MCELRGAWNFLPKPLASLAILAPYHLAMIGGSFFQISSNEHINDCAALYSRGSKLHAVITK